MFEWDIHFFAVKLHDPYTLLFTLEREGLFAHLQSLTSLNKKQFGSWSSLCVACKMNLMRLSEVHVG